MVYRVSVECPTLICSSHDMYIQTHKKTQNKNSERSNLHTMVLNTVDQLNKWKLIANNYRLKVFFSANTNKKNRFKIPWSSSAINYIPIAQKICTKQFIVLQIFIATHKNTSTHCLHFTTYIKMINAHITIIIWYHIKSRA